MNRTILFLLFILSSVSLVFGEVSQEAEDDERNRDCMTTYWEGGDSIMLENWVPIEGYDGWNEVSDRRRPRCGPYAFFCGILGTS